MAQQTGARARALVIISTIAVLLVLLLASAVYAAGGSVITTSYRVRSGDTLWEIAAEHGPAGGDVRRVVDAISEINDLDGALIRPGQVLEIPSPRG